MRLSPREHTIDLAGFYSIPTMGEPAKRRPPLKVEFHPKSEQLQAVTLKSKSLWGGKTAVVAMGDLLTLAAFSLFPPITNTLVGSFSTEREALAACKDKQPDLLYITECLEQVSAGVKPKQAVDSDDTFMAKFAK